MHVQDAARIGRDDTGAQHRQKARQHHQIDLVRPQCFQQCSVKFLAGGVVLAAHYAALYARLCSAFQRKDAGLGGHYQRNFTIGVLAPGLAVQQRLQIGAAAGH